MEKYLKNILKIPFLFAGRCDVWLMGSYAKKKVLKRIRQGAPEIYVNPLDHIAEGIIIKIPSGCTTNMCCHTLLIKVVSGQFSAFEGEENDSCDPHYSTYKVGW